MTMPLTLLPAARTSVTYTTPASTSFSSTLDSVDFTSGSSVTGLTVILALSNTFAAVAPHGTCGWHRATFTLLLARSVTPVTWPGLLGGTAISMTFLTKFVDVDAPPALTTCCMFFGDAEANTSAGAPWLICAARSELAAKLTLTVVPGCAVSNCLASVVNASFSEDAASTVTVPLIAGAELDAAVELAPPAGADEGAGELGAFLLDEHPATSRTAAAAMVAPTMIRRCMGILLNDVKLDRRDIARRSMALYPARPDRCSGTSTTTFVALTEAIAITPGSSSSSSAASRLINDTIRCGPA